MLEITTEIRKGVLFVRLNGQLIKQTVPKLKEEISKLIQDNGIRNVVFNIKELNMIDMKGISSLIYNYKLINENKGKGYICGISHSLVKHRINNSNLLNYMFESSDELGALNIMDLYRSKGHE